jgi:hypothetical protein
MKGMKGMFWKSKTKYWRQPEITDLHVTESKMMTRQTSQQAQERGDYFIIGCLYHYKQYQFVSKQSERATTKTNPQHRGKYNTLTLQIMYSTLTNNGDLFDDKYGISLSFKHKLINDIEARRRLLHGCTPERKLNWTRHMQRTRLIR